MVKQLIGIFLVCSIGFSVLLTNIEDNGEVSDVIKANIEALASDENGGQPRLCPRRLDVEPRSRYRTV